MTRALLSLFTVLALAITPSLLYAQDDKGGSFEGWDSEGKDKEKPADTKPEDKPAEAKPAEA